jgi:ubiquinone/menaquinone biosynthesis C-methylase UbiE
MGIHFREKSYSLHERGFGGVEKDLQESWFREDTSDAWRIDRMYAPFARYIRSSGNSSWLTVGDGRFGLDAIRIRKMDPSATVLPTDINDTLLRESLQRGLINEYKVENAEHLSFADNSFDHVFCKESYHHFPCPAISMYEMLRVARKSVLLLEPNDHVPENIRSKVIWKLRTLIKRLLGKKTVHSDQYRFEEAGNYVYALSKRELEKTALGLALPMIAVKYLNDHYEPGAEFEAATGTSPLLKKIKRTIRKLDRRSGWGLENYRLIAAVIFLEVPGSAHLDALRNSGFEIINLPSNPYLKNTL